MKMLVIFLMLVVNLLAIDVQGNGEEEKKGTTSHTNGGNGHEHTEPMGDTKSETVAFGSISRELAMKTFNAFDTNHNGYIDENDLKNMLETFGIKQSSAETLKDDVKAVFPDYDGRLNLDQFYAFMSTTSGGKYSKKEIQEAFDVFDKNHDHFIQPKEMLAVCKVFNPGMTEEESKKVINDADIDGNGLMDIREFEQVLLKGSIIVIGDPSVESSTTNTKPHHKEESTGQAGQSTLSYLRGRIPSLPSVSTIRNAIPSMPSINPISSLSYLITSARDVLTLERLTGALKNSGKPQIQGKHE